MIEPLYGGKSAHDIFQTLLDNPQLSAYEAVRITQKDNIKDEFETGWRKALHAGWIESTTYAAGGAPKTESSRVPAPNSKDQFEIIFRPDPNIYDGRYSNVGWLQELPKPVTNLSWDNAAIMSGATLESLKLEEDDIVEISAGGGTVKAPVIGRSGPSRQLCLRLYGLRSRIRRPRRLGRRL